MYVTVLEFLVSFEQSSRKFNWLNYRQLIYESKFFCSPFIKKKQ